MAEPTFDVVAVAENNAYMMWQAMLFHYSCLQRTGRAPIVAVHTDGERLLPGFQRIAETGGRVQCLPNFRRELGPDYAALNTISALRNVESDADYFVLCDSDMVFLRDPSLEQLCLADDQVSFDEVPYLVPQAFLRLPAQRAGIPLDQLLDFEGRGGVPHVIPRDLRRPLGDEWLRCMRLFLRRRRDGSPPTKRTFPWFALMWALMLASIRLGIRPVTTHLALTNHASGEPLTPGAGAPALIHYCYGDEQFDKRRFGTEEEIAGVWRMSAPVGSIHAAVCAELRRAGDFYDLKRDSARVAEKALR